MSVSHRGYIRRIVGRGHRELESRILSNKPLMEFIFQFMLIYVALDAIIVAWFLVTPFAVQSSNRLVFGLGMLAYNFGYLVTNCHQMPGHSLIFGTFQMPFCARDTGVYVGSLIGALLPFLKWRVPRWVMSPAFFVLSLMPLIIDGTTQLFLLRESNNLLRVATGLLFGFGVMYFLFANLMPYARRVVNVSDEAKKTSRVAVAFIILLMIISYLVGASYVTEAEAIEKAGVTPTFVTYLSHRSLQTIPLDPYIPSYDDALLREVVRRGHVRGGLWVIYNGTMGHEGKYVYFSGQDVRFSLVGDNRD